MKKTGFIVLIVSLLCCLPAQAQLGDLIGKGISAVQKAKQVKKAVDDVTKKVNGDLDFYMGTKHKGFYRSKSGKIILDDLHTKGELKGKKMVYTIDENGDVYLNDGRKFAELRDGGVVNCQNHYPYLIVAANGDVVMDDEVIGHIDNNGNVTMEGMKIGTAKGIDKQIAAYILFGIYQNKEYIAEKRVEIKARAEQAKQANNNRQIQASGNNNNNNQRVREWKIEKDGKTGYVDANGIVYDWRHNKLGQLPKNGSGSITNLYGNPIGRINMGDIYDNSGKKLATVTSGGSISVPGSNATVAEVRGGGRIDWTKDSKTIGYCDARPYEWAVVLVFCDFFKF